MIIICLKKKIKVFNQTIYNNIIFSLNIKDLKCPNCEAKCSFHHHGSYSRSIIVDDESVTINLARIKCYSCHSTHALLISDLIPYASHPFIVSHPLDDSMISPAYSFIKYLDICLKRARSFKCLFFYFLFPT